MSTAVVLPIKVFDRAKQRLARDDRGEIMREMVARVLGSVNSQRELGRPTYVVTADREAAEIARANGATVVEEGPLRGHSGAASLGIERAMADGASTVVLLAGDCPLLTSRDVQELLRSSGSGPVVVVAPDRHGTGTNALVLEPPDVIRPAFGPGSRARHEERAREAGARCVIFESEAFALDVDTVEDLDAVARAQER